MRYELLHNLDKYAVGIPENAPNLNPFGEYRAAHRLAPYFVGDTHDVQPLTPDVNEMLEALFMRHNRDDRPCGQDGPSLSIGDVVILGNDAYTVARRGFDKIDVRELLVLDESYVEYVERVYGG